MPGNSFPAFARCPPPVIVAKDARLVFLVFDRDQFRSNGVVPKLTAAHLPEVDGKRGRWHLLFARQRPVSARCRH